MLIIHRLLLFDFLFLSIVILCIPAIVLAVVVGITFPKSSQGGHVIQESSRHTLPPSSLAFIGVIPITTIGCHP
jgi:hypothetical protein